MDKFSWFMVGNTLLRVSPPQPIEVIEKQYPNDKVQETHFFYEARMILGMPFSERQPYIDKSPADQKERLVAEIKKQFKERK